MNPNEKGIVQILKEQRGSLDWKIVVWGSLAQLPFAFWMLIRAWQLFPDDALIPYFQAGLLHLAIPVSLVGSFVKYGAYLDFRKSVFLTTLLIIITLLPFILSMTLFP